MLCNEDYALISEYIVIDATDFTLDEFINCYSNDFSSELLTIIWKDVHALLRRIQHYIERNYHGE